METPAIRTEGLTERYGKLDRPPVDPRLGGCPRLDQRRRPHSPARFAEVPPKGPGPPS